MYALNISETQSLATHHWVPNRTQGQRKGDPPSLKIVIYSNGEQYDNISMEGTSSLFTEEVIPLEAIQREISNIRVVIAETNNEIRHIKEIISPVSDMSKDVAVLKSVVSVLKTDVFEIKELITDVAVMKNDIGHLRGYLKIITGLLIGIFIAVAAGVLGNIIQGWLNQ